MFEDAGVREKTLGVAVERPKRRVQERGTRDTITGKPDVAQHNEELAEAPRVFADNIRSKCSGCVMDVRGRASAADGVGSRGAAVLLRRVHGACGEARVALASQELGCLESVVIGELAAIFTISAPVAADHRSWRQGLGHGTSIMA